MGKATVQRGNRNVSRDLAFSRVEAAQLAAKSLLIDAISETIEQRNLPKKEAAKLCVTEQTTPSKVLRGRMENVTIDRLAAWLTALGRTVEIRVRLYNAQAKVLHGRGKVPDAFKAVVHNVEQPAPEKRSKKSKKELGLPKLYTGTFKRGRVRHSVVR